LDGSRADVATTPSEAACLDAGVASTFIRDGAIVISRYLHHITSEATVVVKVVATAISRK
jgi:hypothetical protein